MDSSNGKTELKEFHQVNFVPDLKSHNYTIRQGSDWQEQPCPGCGNSLGTYVDTWEHGTRSLVRKRKQSRASKWGGKHCPPRNSLSLPTFPPLAGTEGLGLSGEQEVTPSALLRNGLGGGL